MLHVYVGSKFQDWERAATVAAKLEATGAIKCVSRWIEVARELQGKEDNRPAEEILKNAEMDQTDLISPDTDLFLLLTPIHSNLGWHLSGGWVEYGMARIAQKHIVICGEHRHQNVFCSFAHYNVYSDDEAVAYVIGYAKAVAKDSE